MTLVKLDDHLVHQTSRPLAEVGSSHPDWQETLYLNVHDRAGRFSALAGLEVMPNAGYVRAYFFTLLDGEHCSYVYAGPLGNWREEIVAGTLAFSIVEPMRAWRVDLADEANGIRAGLDFEARGPAYDYRPIQIESGGQVAIDQSYFTQAGTYRGTFRVGDRTFTDLIGLRARRWGVLVLPSLPFYHWVSFHLPGRWITAWQFESPDGDVLYCDGAIVGEDGRATAITRIAHDWTARVGARHPERCRLALSTAAGGDPLQVECRELGSHFMGQGPDRWSDSDAAALAEADATAMSVEEYCEVTLGDERGLGILDVVSRPGYRRYGIAPLY